MHLLLALLLACSSDDVVAPEAEPAARDVCCEPGEPGEARWESCADSTVLEHVCKRAEICCTVQWAEPCASGYARFAATCAAEEPVAVPSSGAPASSGVPADGTAVPQTKSERLVSLDDADRVKVNVVVEMDPPPETPGGNVFYGGFLEIDEKVGMPVRDALPADYGAVGRWVQDFPVEAELELVDGLHYFVMYGFGEHPGPGNRMAALQRVEGAGELRFTIGERIIPREGEVPEGGHPPGTEPPPPGAGEPPGEPKAAD